MDKDPPFMTTNELRLLAYARAGLTPSFLPAPPNKPWRVTRYKTHWYWGFPIAATYREAHFRWYWQANAVSFVWHHLFGYSCNTWKRNAGTETARIKEPAERGNEAFRLNGPEDTTMRE